MRRSLGLLTLGLLVVVGLAACGDSGGVSADGDAAGGGDQVGSPVGSWTVTSYPSAGALVGVVDGTSPSLEFLEDGTVVGFTGCNRFNATWSGSGSELNITPLATTKMACVDEAASAQEQALVTTLPTVTSWRTTGEGVELLDGSGTTVVTLVAAGG